MTRWARSTAVASAIHRERAHAVARIRNVAESTPRSARLVVNSSNSASNVSAGTYPLTCLRLIIAGLATIAPVIAVGGAVDADMHTTSSPTSSVAPAGTAAAAVAPVAMTVTASACEPNDLNVVSGQVTFAIHNASSRPLEWEILDGVMVVYERENIAPGLIQTLTTRLAPGDYAVTCGLLGNPKGSLHVAALAGADGKPSQADLIGPLAEYRVYASYEIDALVDDTRRLADALKSGDLNLARASFSATHAHYARIAPIAVFFPDLDGAVDAGAGDHDGQPLDAASMGFHQLEWDLFAEAQPRDCRPPAPTIAGAAEAMGAVTLEGIGDVVEPHAGAGLSDLEANVEGVRKIVDLFRPLIEKTDRPLVGALGEDFAILEAVLARYKNADGAFGPSANIGAEDRRIIQDIVKKLSGEVALMRGALGLS
jgi:iron uptake system component EfeO